MLCQITENKNKTCWSPIIVDYFDFAESGPGFTHKQTQLTTGRSGADERLHVHADTDDKKEKRDIDGHNRRAAHIDELLGQGDA